MDMLALTRFQVRVLVLDWHEGLHEEDVGVNARDELEAREKITRQYKDRAGENVWLERILSVQPSQ